MISQVCALARYTLLARLLGPEQLGLAATLILTIQFFQSISDSGSDRFLIQDKDGDQPEVQRLVQGVFIARGLFTATFLTLIAWPASAFLDKPELAFAFAGLAIYPLIAGFLHLDIRRAQRSQDFRSEAWAIGAGELAGFTAMAIAAVLTQQFTAVIYGMIVRSIVMVLISHLRAERNYEVGFSREHAPRLAKFATPLLLNGALLFVGSQGDRVVVGGQLGFAALGHYTAVLLLILSPAAILQRFTTAMHLPRIAAGRDDNAAHLAAAEKLASLTLVLGMSMAAGFALVAPWVVVLLYGAKFSQPAHIIGLIGVLQAARFIRQWPTTIALATGRSGIVLANNLVRMTGLLAAVVGAFYAHSLEGVVAGFVLGELLALATAVLMLNRALGQPILHDFDRLLAFISVAACIVFWTTLLKDPTVMTIAFATIASSVVLAWVVRREISTLREGLNSGLRIFRRLRKRTA